MKDKNRPISIADMSACRLHKFLQSKGYLLMYSVPAKQRYLVASLREYSPEMYERLYTPHCKPADIIVGAAKELDLNLNRSPKTPHPQRPPSEFMAEFKAELRAEKIARKAERKAKKQRKATRPAYSPVMSDSFLQSYEWKRVRMEALKLYGARCQCCGATSADTKICVDHIKPRRLFPHLALDLNNLQILCHDCNHGKGNWDTTDWRPDPTVDVGNVRYYAEQLAHMRDISDKAGD